MGRHSTDHDGGPEAPGRQPDAVRRAPLLGPVTDPVLLDAVEEEWRRSASRTGAVRAPRVGPGAAVPAGMRRIETPFSGAVDVPAGPGRDDDRTPPGDRGRWIETPFSGAILLESPSRQPRPSASPVDGRPAGGPARTRPASQALPAPHAPRPAIQPAALVQAARPVVIPVTGRPGPGAPRSLPALLAGGPQPEAVGADGLGRTRTAAAPSRPVEADDDAQQAHDAIGDPVEVGLSGRSLALGLAVGFGVAAVLSIVAVLPV